MPTRFAWIGLVAVSAVAVGFGCKRADSPNPGTLAETASPAAAAGKTNPAGVTPIVVSTGQSADEAWALVLKDAEPPDLPAEWTKRKPSEDEVQAFLKTMNGSALQAADRAREFARSFPDHPRAREATLREYRHVAVAAHFGDAPAKERLAQLEKSLATAKLEEAQFFLMKSSVVHRLGYLDSARPGLIPLTALNEETRMLQREFPNSGDLPDLLLNLSKAYLRQDKIAEARAVAQEVAKGSASSAFKEDAEGLLRSIDRIGKPLAIAFTAADGKPFSLENHRGKVVLIDFWASWCVYCIAEMPHIRAVHEKLKGRGFEVVGISLDEEKPAMEKAIAEHKMPWPQFFDGKGYEGKYAAEFGITSLPTLWLIDKKGMLRDINAGTDLDAKVEKLLAE